MLVQGLGLRRVLKLEPLALELRPLETEIAMRLARALELQPEQGQALPVLGWVLLA